MCAWLDNQNVSLPSNLKQQTAMLGLWNEPMHDPMLIDHMILTFKRYIYLNPKQAGGGGGGGIRPQAGSSLCCAETVSSRKLKLSDFYYILIGLNSEYKPVPWDIHCCHGNAIVEWCSVKFWLKSVENCIFLLKSFSNLSLGLLFVISISKLPPVPNFKQIGLKAKKLGFSTFFLAERSLKYKMTS